MRSASTETKREARIRVTGSIGLALALLFAAMFFRALLSNMGVPLPLVLGLGTVVAFGLGGIVLKGARPWPRMGRCDCGVLASCAMLGVGLALLGAMTLLLVVHAMPPPEAWHQGQAMLLEQILRPDRLAWIPVVLLVVAILPGTLEEFFFRGVLWEHWQGVQLRTRVVGIAAIFALIHMDPWSAPALFGIGVACGLVAERAQGWIAAAVVHVFLNAFNGVVWVRLPWDTLEPRALALCLAVAGGTGAVLTVLAWRRLRCLT